MWDILPSQYFEASIGGCFIVQFMLMILISRVFRYAPHDRTLQVKYSYFVYSMVIYSMYAVLSILLFTFPQSKLLEHTWSGFIIPTTPVTVLYLIIDGRYLDRPFFFYVIGRQSIITILVTMWVGFDVYDYVLTKELTPYLLMILSLTFINMLTSVYNYLNGITRYSTMRIYMSMAIHRLARMSLWIITIVLYSTNINGLILLITSTLFLDAYDLIGEIKSIKAHKIPYVPNYY